ncbi:GH-E family nuclease [Arachnia propionica]|jgi:hypothetical protein|uniref:GH-E family nuclease n=1 Tax=Arachnia propionica TaxID=1750 RepID=UPI0028EB43B2|nr:GH-E family nuclease [Arachnia propionica]
MGLTPVELDSPEQIRLRARKLERTLNSVSAKSSTIRTTWSSLTTSYSAPEADIVHNAMNKPDDWARTLKGHAKTMREALVTYADRLDELKVVRDQLVKDIAAHEGAVKEADSKKTTVKSKASPNLPGSNTGPSGTVSNVTVVEGGVTPELVEQANELATRVEQFQTDLEDAQRTCGNKLNATWGGPQFVQIDKTSVNNPYAWGTSMDAKRDQTRTGKEAWGSPDAWKLANKNKQASGLLLRQGAWKSVVDGWNDLKDLVGLGGDPGATEHKRSGLAKIAVDFSAFSILSTPLGFGLMSYDKNARQRYMESSATVGAVLKGMISYDTWSADPIGTYGGFVPDMVTTAVSMGSGGAAKLSVKALSMVSPGAAVKAARVLRVLRQVDPGFVDDIKRTVKVSHGSTDVRRLETVTGTLPHVKADGSGITPTHPHTGPGPIERSMSGADGGHPGKADVGGGSQPRTNADSAQVPERHGSGPDGPAKPTTPGDVEPRRAAPEAQGADQPSGSPARRAEDTHTSQGQSGSGETAHHAPEASTDARPDAHPGRLPGDADPHSRVPDGSSPSERPVNPMDGSQGGRNTHDPSPDAPGDGRSGSGHSDNSPQPGESGKPASENRGDGDHSRSGGDGSGSSRSQEGLERPRNGTSVTPGSKGRVYDPGAPARETISAKEWEKRSGYRYTQEDVQRALDEGPRNGDGQPVDHRNGRPLQLTQGAGENRGWVMRYDPESGTWLPENRGLNEGGLPAKGEPNSYGYDGNGDLLPYANERPKYTEKQIEDVWTKSRNDQIKRIENGTLDLPEPGADRMWVRTVDDAAEGPGVHVDAKGHKWREVEWKPGQSREGLWDMGHVSDAKYSKLRDKYLSGEISKKEFLEEFHDANNYRVEDPLRNRSHVDE